MAFITSSFTNTFISLHDAHSNFTGTPVCITPTRYVTTPFRRVHRTQHACPFLPNISMSTSRRHRAPAAVSVKRANTPSDLDDVYTIWNTITSSEGLPSVSPDELDSAQSTIHLLAYASEEENQEQEDGHMKTIVGAARLVHDGPNNVRLDRVCVLPAWRQRGIGRALVNEMLKLADGANGDGAVFVDAMRGHDMGFFSILGFEPVGNDRIDDDCPTVVRRTMLLRVPVCEPVTDSGCVGLHHASLRVSDIERSLAFYGSVGFFVSEKFITSAGARACFVEGLGTRLELVECPAGDSGTLAGVQGVFDRLVFDVTKACTDLDVYLQHIQRRNGGLLQIAGPPAKQIIGNSVMSVASIQDPDGMPIEFIRREAQVPGELRTRVNW